MLAPDTILQNRYRVVRQLGQGGMGTVYEAFDQRLDTTVALKETHATDESQRRQFEREAQLLARLHHPALPRVSDHFTEGDGQFLVMQFVAGEDLGEMILRRAEGFPVNEVLGWADELLDALDYLHTQAPPVIHRDIKPQNLKLSDRGRVILLDFGLAKGLPAAGTTLKSVLGYTPSYAPLEQIQDEGTDARSDLYSLGATVYHLLTGAVPPGSLKRVTALSNGEEDPLVPARQLNPRTPAEVSTVLNLALAIARNNRPASAAEMRRALQQAGASSLTDGNEERTVIQSTVTDPSSAATQLPPPMSPPGRVRQTSPVQSSTPPAGPRRSFNRLLLISALLGLLVATAVFAYRFTAQKSQAGAGETTVVKQNAAITQTPPAIQSDAEKKAAAGQQLFQSLDCVKCHGIRGEGKIGPALAGLLGEEVRLSNQVTTVADESYIRESILVPQARVVAGYKPIMPSFQGKLSDEQVSQLVAYIVSLDR
ncbi:MAG: protein kinase domain-containing protein [Pyrinomonadaceae bacterium]